MGNIFLIAAATILISLQVHSSMITSNNGVIDCDGIICPANSTSCIVSKKTYDDLKFYKYIRLCTDAVGAVTQSAEQELPNPIPGTIINSISSYGGHSVLSNQEKKKLDGRIEAMEKEHEEYWRNWTSDFNANMRKQFPPGFPFN